MTRARQLFVRCGNGGGGCRAQHNEDAGKAANTRVEECDAACKGKRREETAFFQRMWC
jgi:hypothetical protein